LTSAALKLPPGDERCDTLRGIGNFRERISDLKQVATHRATMLELRRTRKVAASRWLSPSQLSEPASELTALTDRERQIMRLVSEGLSNKEIGRRLSIVDGTIKVHLHNIFQKLKIGNRTVLAALAISETNHVAASSAEREREKE